MDEEYCEKCRVFWSEEEVWCHDGHCPHCNHQIWPTPTTPEAME